MRIAPPEFHRARATRLADLLRDEALSSLIVTAPANTAYLTGFFGSAGIVLATPNRLRLVVDGRYTEIAQRRAAELDAIDLVIVPFGSSYDEIISALVAEEGGDRVGFEAGHQTVAAHRDLERRLSARAPGVDLIPTDGLVEQLRLTKDVWEAATLREAGARLSEVAKYIVPKVLSGIIEKDLAGTIEQELRRVGFAKPAFDTIVASGPNSAMPHYRAGERQLSAGDLVVLDFGGVLDGYCVDLTRTVAIGTPDRRQRQALEHVGGAQASAFEVVASGRLAENVDQAARDYLVREGLADAFTHGTGHGLGLEIHERPRVGPRRTGQAPEPIEVGMVFTLEPGVYFPGWGGVRIEDDVLVTTRGAEWLTHVPRTA